MKANYEIPNLPFPFEVESKKVLKQLAKANRALAELKGIAQTIPNEDILLRALVLQEAKESSAIENIVTTHDELYQAAIASPHETFSPASKEILNYRDALTEGFRAVKRDEILTNNMILKIQEYLEQNNAGFRSQSGTSLKNNIGEVIYTPPQDIMIIQEKMSNLEKFINTPEISDLDPLIKMAIIHHQFESIHPFYDGNGRTGRIIMILYLVLNKLLGQPILFLSRYIIETKDRYYKLLQEIHECTSQDEYEAKWQEWIIYILYGVEITALSTTTLVLKIRLLMEEYKPKLREAFGKTYRHELINNLFYHPYTKISFMSATLNVERKTASKYLDKIVDLGLLEKLKVGKENYYINTALYEILRTH